MYALKLSSAVVVDGMPTDYIGPFKSYDDAKQWFIGRSECLDTQGVENVTIVYMKIPA